MILTFTDFGGRGPYLTQMKAAIRKHGFKGDIWDLFSDAPSFDSKCAARLLGAYSPDFPRRSVFLSVVDPGVGSDRGAIAIKSLGQWFVGPDNGLFEYVIRQDPEAEIYQISWRPEKLSSSFHGRDLFAPVAAKIALGEAVEVLSKLQLSEIVRHPWPEQMQEIIYIDHYGNAMTGVDDLEDVQGVRIGGDIIPLLRTFSDADKGASLAYKNANGLLEISVNQGRADQRFDLSVGSPINVIRG
ncbi:hypothetical protein GUA87_01005 [Sneathiella sp. P13V-1]|uniref:SAM hydrolase/SAM-dependent halogenase family protein n=1 Tax=Sneathiella sp. P13V-1 TaxID=2697366 RepID=UPI00187B33AF|nr:SAM-dependent chlorinase/fluorinase [Sneathiella sp. P13V-1]MBE7635407.1 hypothetical protein [Sneathiella sp. P13V-1]